MSRMAALIFVAVSAVSPSPPAGTGLTAEQAMANYRTMLGNAATTASECPPSVSGEIVVCRRDVHPAPRLPMPEARAEPGEVVHHLGEPPKVDQGPPAGPPSRLMETLGRGFGLLKSAVTGEDSGN